MSHKVHLYDVEKGFDADGVMRPVKVLETEDPAEAVRTATEALAQSRSISAAYIQPDWRLCATLAEYLDLGNALGRYVEANPEIGGWIGQLVEDPAHWADCGVETPEQLEKYLLLQSYSDVYKDTYGVRPRGASFTMETPIEEIEAAYAAMRVSADPEDGPSL